jgi:hypothetical protein
MDVRFTALISFHFAQLMHFLLFLSFFLPIANPHLQAQSIQQLGDMGLRGGDGGEGAVEASGVPGVCGGH